VGKARRLLWLLLLLPTPRMMLLLERRPRGPIRSSVLLLLPTPRIMLLLERRPRGPIRSSALLSGGNWPARGVMRAIAATAVGTEKGRGSVWMLQYPRVRLRGGRTPILPDNHLARLWRPPQ